jgi:uncharacterized protein YjbI with pentapeptide repeats
MPMLFPQRAPVRPRVSAHQGSELLLLEDEILALAGRGARGLVYVLGPAGSGKTTALRHLATVLPARAGVVLSDEDDPASAEALHASSGCLVVCAAAMPHRLPFLTAYHLAPWGKDELIEYLLAAHPAQCASVMARVSSEDHKLLRGLPELWRVVLDQFARDAWLAGAQAALYQYAHALVGARDAEQVGRACLKSLTEGTSPPKWRGKTAGWREIARILRHAEVQLLFAAQRAAADLRDRAKCKYLAHRLSRPLVQAIGAAAAADGRALDHLLALLVRRRKHQPMASSILLAATPEWAPAAGQVPVLSGAYLEHAAWSGVELPGANLGDAHLAYANLSKAQLDEADASGADLRHAWLAGASLVRWNASQADLTGAVLTSVSAAKSCWDWARFKGATFEDADVTGASFCGADLTETVFAGANLMGAELAGATIKEADFSGADLTGASLVGLRLRDAAFRGACFAEANLAQCDLEEMDLAGADFHHAHLEGALLSDASLAGADLHGASLRETGLGNVSFEGANLRDADLRGATFHMGNSRCGLVLSPIACEGSRTGFYTDDEGEQHFKPPEEIRKANLCGADLRGAKIAGGDFYLVDLRGALYDGQQEEHFRRCGAILGAVTAETA